MGSAITKTLYMEDLIKKGLEKGIYTLGGSVVRDAATKKIVKHLTEVAAKAKPNGVGAAVAVGAVVVAGALGAYLWVQNRNQAADPLETAVNALQADLKKGSLELQTAQSLHQRLGAFVTQWQARATDKTATLPKDQVEALERLLKLLTEINQQIPPEALESGEVQGSIHLLETALAPVPVAVGVA